MSKDFENLNTIIKEQKSVIDNLARHYLKNQNLVLLILIKKVLL
jgi:hypothetical protein